MIILTSANAWNEKEKFISKLHEWEDALRKITKQFIDLEVAKKIPIVPVGYKEPQLPDRPSWVTDIWVQGFRRMSFTAKIKYLNKPKMNDATDEVEPSKTMLEDQPLVACYMSKDEVWINPEDVPMMLKTMCGPGVLAYTISGVGNWVASALEHFGWVVKENEVHCYDEAILYSLIAASLATSANAWNEKEKFISKLHEWEDALRKITKQFIDLEVAKKIPIVPAGYKEPQLPDRPSWVTDIWVQGFRRMGFTAKIKYLNKPKMNDATDEVKPSKTMLEDQPLVSCYMSKDEVWINPEDVPMMLKPMCGPGVLAYTISGVGNWVASALEHFGWVVKENEVHCYDEAILYSLIAASLEEHPEYKEALYDYFPGIKL